MTEQVIGCSRENVPREFKRAASQENGAAKSVNPGNEVVIIAIFVTGRNQGSISQRVRTSLNLRLTKNLRQVIIANELLVLTRDKTSLNSL